MTDSVGHHLHRVAPYLMTPFDGPVNAVVTPPGSKSFTNRALITASLAEGESLLTGVLFSDDTEAMLECIAAMGVGVFVDREHATVRIEGCGGRPTVDGVTLQTRQSGTTTRFVTPMAALGHGSVLIDGHAQMRARPNLDLVHALAKLGCEIRSQGSDEGFLPLQMSAIGVQGGAIEIAGNVSSQFLSGLLLSAPCFVDGLHITVVGELVSKPYVDITLSTMRSFGAQITQNNYRSFSVAPTGYRATQYAIEPDASAASYFFAVPAIVGGRITVEGLGSDAQQGDMGFVDVLEQMGMQVVRESNRTTVIRAPGEQLRGIDIDMTHISDTAQTLAAVAVFAESATNVRGIGFIRHKEINRVAAVVTELQRCGIDAVEHDDGFSITPGMPKPATIETSEDHRMAMSFALLGLRAPGIAIAGPDCVAKTFPNYFAEMESLRPAGPSHSGMGSDSHGHSIMGSAGTGQSGMGSDSHRRSTIGSAETGHSGSVTS
jgi:3-phosphoshikimate 1-carboxyvinyltransferase